MSKAKKSLKQSQKRKAESESDREFEEALDEFAKLSDEIADAFCQIIRVLKEEKPKNVNAEDEKE